MKDQLLPFIVETARSIAEEQGIDVSKELNDSTRLFGEGGLLDSLALVSLVIAVEQGIEERFGVRVEIADDKALSQKNSPYRTIGSLAAYAAQELEAKKAAG
ncbi:acyl carrier protein [Povalibacter uvarum]|uniref:Acyl carrier protein n=1 Tax=Povalibacter uvarum TaxID=732238 RepID=A0A841HHW0_9GAMM|nr:acyl carrier protein [Povalibacter uvarum]MBB6091655.1 acyl carrier protein [Povalibacter uvarum]